MRNSGFGIPALCLLLAGCGGSGESVTSTPPPPPPPAATPLPLTASASFETITSAMTYSEPPTGSGSFGSLQAGPRGPAISFSYDAASGTYNVQGNGVSASFGQTDQIPDTSYSDTFSKTIGNASDSVKLYGNARSDTPGTPPVVLSYTSYGIWTHSDNATGQTSKTYFVYGQPTGAANMPVTGTASYQMTASAHMYPGGVGTASTRILGTATLNANFGTGAIDTVLKFGGTYSGTGTISADQFSGTFTTQDPSALNGSFFGGFFGPGAKEAGYTFQIHIHVSDPYAGAAIQPPDTYIAGAAVGTKG